MYGTTEPSPFIVHLGQLLADFAVETAKFDALITQWGMFKIGMSAFMQQYDVIICPVTASPPLTISRAGRLPSYVTAPRPKVCPSVFRSLPLHGVRISRWP
jgi:Asp-tRNA(Asn)/Glu-tRNA(Gln) amidotransferase A subunit family amidase